MPDFLATPPTSLTCIVRFIQEGAPGFSLLKGSGQSSVGNQLAPFLLAAASCQEATEFLCPQPTQSSCICPSFGIQSNNSTKQSPSFLRESPLCYTLPIPVSAGFNPLNETVRRCDLV